MKIAVAPDQQSLFGGPAAPPRSPRPLEQRFAAMEAAHDAAKDDWKKAFTAFLERYAANRGQFTAEDVRLAYEASPNPQLENSKRASGAIYKDFVRRGKLRKVGKKLSSLYGNELTVYEEVK